eukprot:gene11196-15016_t
MSLIGGLLSIFNIQQRKVVCIIFLLFIQAAYSYSMGIRVYFVRHGQTIANKDGILQGHIDFPLTDLGVNQAEVAGDSLRDVQFHHIISSDLPRAFHTSRIISHRFYKTISEDEIVQTKLLRELNFGVREGLPRGTTVCDAKAIVASNLNLPVDEIVDNAEKPEEVFERQRQFLNYLHSVCHQDLSNIKDFNILAVSHGGYIRSFIRNFTQNEKVIKIDNCSVTIMEIKWNDIGNCDTVECSAKEDKINIHPSDIFSPTSSEVI